MTTTKRKLARFLSPSSSSPVFPARVLVLVLAMAVAAAGVSGAALRMARAEPEVPAPAAGAPGVDEARRFVARVNDDLKVLTVRAGTAEWIKNTYITDDTER